jgi:hypothetical protein
MAQRLASAEDARLKKLAAGIALPDFVK